MNVEIRKVKPGDLTSLSELFNQYRIFYGMPPDKAAAMQFMAERLLNRDSEILVADAGMGILTGFTQLYPLFSSVNMKRLWLLNDLFVSENCRRKGIARQLIYAAKKMAFETNAVGILLETAITNDAGNKLYPASGFIQNDKSHYYFWTT
jgi:ribosomal protein S18 acetylase RimI-like enzyme